MPPNWSKAALALVTIAIATNVADAQIAPQGTPRSPTPAFTSPPVGTPQPLSNQDAELLRDGLSAARTGDVARAQSDRATMTNPVGRKLVLWALIDAAPDHLSFFELDQARRDLWGWPRANGRQIAAEKLLETSGLSPQKMVDWFEGGAPQSAQGVMALASAYRALNRTAEAQALVKKTWREMLFEADLQRTMLDRFGGLLSSEDHIRRLDSLLYGPQGPAARDILTLVPAEHQSAALARMALRQGAANAISVADAVSPPLNRDPGLVFERARYLRRRGMDVAALTLVSGFPSVPAHSEGAKLVWKERWALFNAAMRAKNYQAAYDSLQNHGLPAGGELADAEFFAGWLALSKMRDPIRADRHFERLQRAGSSPITLGRAYYWRGRAKEAAGEKAAAHAFYEQGGRYHTSFYGQLAAEKAGKGHIRLGKDPAISPADRARFEGREPVRAARLLAEGGQKDLFRAFVLFIDDVLPTAEENALLVDFARGYGDQELAMRVVRAAAQRGFVLPERGYPMRSAPLTASAEPALVLGIVRQESGFDPMVRSGAGARGMMQLMPATAAIVARQQGVSYSPAMLDDPDFNMRLGSAYISQMVDQFSGSYLLAAAAYNAGPGRPAAWVTTCGDPRAAASDPADFIECIPFSETRNYVMRVLEGMQVYRARLNGGEAKITLASDLKRDDYGYARLHTPVPAPLASN